MDRGFDGFIKDIKCSLKNIPLPWNIMLHSFNTLLQQLPVNITAECRDLQQPCSERKIYGRVRLRSWWSLLWLFNLKAIQSIKGWLQLQDLLLFFVFFMNEKVLLYHLLLFEQQFEPRCSICVIGVNWRLQSSGMDGFVFFHQTHLETPASRFLISHVCFHNMFLSQRRFDLLSTHLICSQT